MGVPNKYCAVCNKAENNTPPEHTCYLNWKGSLSSMKADVIPEGFNNVRNKGTYNLWIVWYTPHLFQTFHGATLLRR